MLKWGKSHQLAGGGSLQPPDYFCSTSGCIRGRASKLLGGIRQLLAITHLEPDILECEVKWVLGSITLNKTSGGDGIPVELFQILKDDAVKVLHSICQQIWKTQQWPQDWKRSVFIPIPKKGVPKNAQTTTRLHSSHTLLLLLLSHVSRV